MKKIIAFNWKMNPASNKEVKKLFKIVSNSDTIVFPPFVYLNTQPKLKKARLGAQNLFWENSPRQLAGRGAFTGEISA